MILHRHHASRRIGARGKQDPAKGEWRSMNKVTTEPLRQGPIQPLSPWTQRRPGTAVSLGVGQQPLCVQETPWRWDC